MNKYQEDMTRLNAHFIYEGVEERSSVSEGDMAELEGKLGQPLPFDYKQFLSDFGGYSLYSVCFPNEDAGRDVGFWIDLFYGVNVGPTLDLLRTWETAVVNEVMPSTFLPIATSGSMSQILIFLDDKEKGAIYYLSGDEYEVPYNLEKFRFLAPSFDEFLSALQLIEDDA